MYSALSPGVIGVKVENLSQRIAAAKDYGFGGVELNIHEIADLIDATSVEAVSEQFLFADVIAAGWGFPINWNASDEIYQSELEKLPRLAKAAESIGCFRTFTWIGPASNERPFEENLKFHIERFTPIAKILLDHGQRLGLEFIGPKTIRNNAKYEFIHDMPEMMAMVSQIGPNVGLLLDCWHLYTSHGTATDIEYLEEKDVVYVHVNDAPSGIPVDEQVDGTRGLPGETGVIDIAGFLNALKHIGYSGPVVPEPFKKELNDLPNDKARLEVVAASMRKIFDLAKNSVPEE